MPTPPIPPSVTPIAAKDDQALDHWLIRDLDKDPAMEMRYGPMLTVDFADGPAMVKRLSRYRRRLPPWLLPRSPQEISRRAFRFLRTDPTPALPVDCRRGVELAAQLRAVEAAAVR